MDLLPPDIQKSRGVQDKKMSNEMAEIKELSIINMLSVRVVKLLSKFLHWEIRSSRQQVYYSCLEHHTAALKSPNALASSSTIAHQARTTYDVGLDTSTRDLANSCFMQF